MKKEYIERTNAKLRFNYNDDYKGNVVKNILDYVPAADVAPVKHGKWEIKKIGDGGTTRTCSNCNITQTVNVYNNKVMFNYCPYCGAKMDGENNEDNMQ